MWKGREGKGGREGRESRSKNRALFWHYLKRAVRTSKQGRE